MITSLTEILELPNFDQVKHQYKLLNNKNSLCQELANVALPLLFLLNHLLNYYAPYQLSPLSESIKKENVKQQVRNEQTWWLHLINYCKDYCQNQTCNVRRTCIFHLLLFGTPSFCGFMLSSYSRKGPEQTLNLTTYLNSIVQQEYPS